MKIFITGATGFIGTHLTHLLVGKGHDITVLLRTEKKRKSLPSNIKVIKGDLSLFQDQALKLPPFDIVIHLAGVIFAKNKAEYFKYNFHAVEDLIHCIQRQEWIPKRFLFASSLAAAGASGADKALTEHDSPHPVDPYGEAKLKAEHFLQGIEQFPTTSFRPAIVLGPGDENSLTLFKMAKKNIGININGKAQFITFVDVGDLICAIVKMMEDASREHKKYFVAHPNIISNIDLFQTLGKVMDKKIWMIPLPQPILYAAMIISTFFSKIIGTTNQLDNKQYYQLINHFICSSKALQKELNWKPKYNLEESIRKAYEGYQKVGKI